MTAKTIEYTINEKGCHICTSHSKTPNGYIRLHRNGKWTQLHRYLYEQSYGELSYGIIVRHKCDEPSCINIEHLELGTHQDNMDDKRIRGRAKTDDQDGENNNNSKLTWDNVRDIRRSEGRSNKDIARQYNVSHQLISLIRRNIRWAE